ncbi:MAG: ribbon-helix-helix protein, CopG family [Gemmatimonadales bacterium]
MRRTTVFLDEPLLRRLKQRARAEDRSFASLVREALAEYLARGGGSGSSLPGVTGAFESGHSDTAERHEELLSHLIAERRRADPR